MVDELEVGEEEEVGEEMMTGIGERYVDVDGRTRQRKAETTRMTHATKRQGERIVSGVVLVQQFV